MSIKGTNTKPLTRNEIAAWYKRPPSLSIKLPWREYDPEHQCFLLADGVSVAAGFILSDVSSEARTEVYLQRLQQGLQGVFQDAIPQYFDDQSPWVIQFFLQDERSFDEVSKRFEAYVKPELHGSRCTEQYLDIMREHLKLMTKPGGLFFDDKVANQNFSGRVRKIRCVLYRELTSKSKRSRTRTAIQDLNTVAQSVAAKLQGAGVGVTRMQGHDFYSWMVRWFNPAPQLTHGDVDQLLNLYPYPKEEMPYGYDFAERLFYNIPRSNQDEGVWYFDELPHKYLPIAGLGSLPKTGHLTLERQFGNFYYGLFDRFPEGSVFQMTVVIQSQELVKNNIDRIERSTKKATSMQAEMAREDCRSARRMVESNNFLFPTCMGVFLRGNTLNELIEHENAVETLLANAGFIVVSGESELLPIDSYLRFLPMSYNYALDHAYLFKSRYQSAMQLSQLLPLYGRERGTAHPILPFFNRGGEPFWIDPFNTKDKDNNSHLLMLGTTGSGKSATCVYLMMTLMALYRPRLVIVDAGNSFQLLGEYFKEMGLSVNRVEISLNTPVSLNPFADSEKMLAQLDANLSREAISKLADAQGKELHESREGMPTAFHDLARRESSESAGVTMGGNEDGERGSQRSQSLKGEGHLENRDYMGEMSLAAQLLITGGDKKEEAKISREDRMLIIEGLVKAARKAREIGQQMLPQDLATAFLEMSKEHDAIIARRLQEMANGIKVFCSDTLSAQFFNRPGQPWIESDVTLLEMGLFSADGYEAQRALAFMGAMNKTQSMAEAHQQDARFTVFFGDECHVVTKNPLTAVAITKCAKMSRKIGLWLWLATQNVEDFPSEARKLLSMVEFWLCLGMSEAELSEVERFRSISPEERSLFRSVRKASGKYVEGILLCNRVKGLFRNIPPRLALALAMTEKYEKAERKKLMTEFQITEIEAAKRIAARMITGAKP